MKDWGHHPLSTWTTPPQARHLGIDPGLINKDDITNPAWVRQQPGLTLAPDRAGGLDIRALLLRSVRGFFPADVPCPEPVVDGGGGCVHPMYRTETVGQLLQGHVRRLLDPAQNIVAIGIKAALSGWRLPDRDSPFLFVALDKPDRRTRTYLEMCRRPTTGQARGHFPNHANTQVI